MILIPLGLYWNEIKTIYPFFKAKWYIIITLSAKWLELFFGWILIYLEMQEISSGFIGYRDLSQVYFTYTLD